MINKIMVVKSYACTLPPLPAEQICADILSIEDITQDPNDPNLGKTKVEYQITVPNDLSAPSGCTKLRFFDGGTSYITCQDLTFDNRTAIDGKLNTKRTAYCDLASKNRDAGYMQIAYETAFGFIGGPNCSWAWPRMDTIVEVEHTPIVGGTQGLERVYFAGTPQKVCGSTFSHQFTIKGKPLGGSPNYAIRLYKDNEAVGGAITQNWPAEYSCDAFEWTPLSTASPDTVTVNCNLYDVMRNGVTSGGSYTMVLYKNGFTAGDIINTVDINMDIGGFAGSPYRDTSSLDMQQKKIYDVPINVYEAINAPLKITLTDNSDVEFGSCSAVPGAGGCGITKNINCDFSKAPEGQYRLNLINTNNSTLIDSQLISIPPLTPTEADTNGACGCFMGTLCTNPADLSSAGWSYTSCLLGTSPKAVSCTPGTYSCSCQCQGTPTTSTPVTSLPPGYGGDTTGGFKPPQFGTDDLTGALATLQSILIAVGVVGSVIMLPYAFVLISTGQPENIQKGWDWIKSIGVGLIILILSSTIIRLIGRQVLGL